MTRTAFMDLDTQEDFMRPGGALYVPGAETIIPNLRRLFGAAREKGIPVISSLDAHLENDPEFADWPPHCVSGTPGQRKIPETIFPDVQVIENRPQAVAPRRGAQIVLEKRIYSIFDNVNIDVVFRKLDLRDFVVFGVATEYCVKAAVLGLLERAFPVRLVVDAIRPVSAEGGRAALEQLGGARAKLVTADEVLASL